jgi:outer membrane immunogenic protein
MKKMLVAAAALAAVIARPALAADMALKATPPPALAYSWTGFYIGVNAGGTWGTFDPLTSTVFSPIGYFASSSVPAIGTAGIQSIKPSGFTGGFEAGYNWQSGNIVFGIEADIESFQLKGTATTGPVLYPCCAPTSFTIASNASTSWLNTDRARLGIAFNNWLFFVTGGAAITNLNANFAFTDTFATAAESASISSTRLGWTAGGGIEASLWRGWSVKAEYLFVDFGRVSVNSTNLTAFTPPINFPTNVFTHSVDLTASIARVGLNYRFGGI